jgi:hypothetical protein
LLGPLSPVSLMRRVHSASYSLRERRIGTDKRPAVSSACRNVEWLLFDEHSSVVTGAIWPAVARCGQFPVLTRSGRTTLPIAAVQEQRSGHSLHRQSIQTDVPRTESRLGQTEPLRLSFRPQRRCKDLRRAVRGRSHR